MIAKRVTTGEAERFSFTWDADDKAAAEQISKKLDRSLAWLVRTAIREYLARSAGGRMGDEL